MIRRSYSAFAATKLCLRNKCNVNVMWSNKNFRSFSNVERLVYNLDGQSDVSFLLNPDIVFNLYYRQSTSSEDLQSNLSVALKPREVVEQLDKFIVRLH